jgi:two-component system probable response regulator PhcQ
MSRLMIVDDEEAILRSLRRLLLAVPCTYKQHTYALEVEIFASPRQALERARHAAFDLFLVDFRMPEMDGVAFLKAVKAVQPEAMRIVISGYADLNALVGAINEAEIYRFLPKPWNDYELVSAIAQALSYRDLALENQRLADQVRQQQGKMTPQELEMKRLEALEPGLTKVNWGPDGSVVLDEEFRDLD